MRSVYRVIPISWLGREGLNDLTKVRRCVSDKGRMTAQVSWLKMPWLSLAEAQSSRVMVVHQTTQEVDLCVMLGQGMGQCEFTSAWFCLFLLLLRVYGTQVRGQTQPKTRGRKMRESRGEFMIQADMKSPRGVTS